MIRAGSRVSSWAQHCASTASTTPSRSRVSSASSPRGSPSPPGCAARRRPGETQVHRWPRARSRVIASSYGLYTGAGRRPRVLRRGAATLPGSTAAGGAGAVWDGKWHHVAGTFDGSTVRLFVDGAEVGTGTPARPWIDYSLPGRTAARSATTRARCTGRADPRPAMSTASRSGRRRSPSHTSGTSLKSLVNLARSRRPRRVILRGDGTRSPRHGSLSVYAAARPRVARPRPRPETE